MGELLCAQALAARSRVILAVVGSLDRDKVLIDVIEQPTAAAFSEMHMRAGGEDDGSPIRIC